MTVRRVDTNDINYSKYKKYLNEQYGKFITEKTHFGIEELCDKFFGGLSKEQIIECLKDKYPENFI